MNLPTIEKWATKKGINLMGTGDFTHPAWVSEIQENLQEEGGGIYKLKGIKSGVNFLLTSEVSCIYTHENRGRRVHLLVFLPTIKCVKSFNNKLVKRGANLSSDARPIIGLSLYEVAEIALDTSDLAIMIPAHVWTPWYGFYGHKSGFNSLTEAFGDLEQYIPAIETGLSSDPEMNWRISELNNKSIVSFGDAHSPQKIGREATVFDLDKLSFVNLRNALYQKGNDKISYTIEFYPQEGKYHYTGHRNCKVVYPPKKVVELGLTCPTCGKDLTMGVMNRVEFLSSQKVDTIWKINRSGVMWVSTKNKDRPPYTMLIPLHEIISEVMEIGINTKGVSQVYENMTGLLGSEYDILLKVDLSEITNIAGAKIARAIKMVRKGDIRVTPGYDGVFGKVKILKGDEGVVDDPNQKPLF